MQYPIEHIDPVDAFSSLAHIPQVPTSLTLRGTLENITGKKLIVFVGSRECTSYGKATCRALIEGLRGYPVIIVSGLAIGMDAAAHESALAVGLPTIAFPGSGLNETVLYPARHRELAERILRAGGALISEYAPDQKCALWTFPKRNRLMAGIADMVIVVEAQEKSGSLITARLATEYNRTVGAVPGPVSSKTSSGANWLLKLGAVPITESADIIRELSLIPTPPYSDEELAILHSGEEAVLALLSQPLSRTVISDTLSLSPSELNVILSTLEIKGEIREYLGLIERVHLPKKTSRGTTSIR